MARRERHVTRIVPVGDIDVAFGSMVRTVPRRSVAKWPDKRRDDQDPRLFGVDILPKPQQGAERGDMGRLLGDLDLRLPTMTLRMP